MKVLLEREGKESREMDLDDTYMHAVGVEILTVEEYQGFYLFTSVRDDGVRVLTWAADDIYKYVESLKEAGRESG